MAKKTTTNTGPNHYSKMRVRIWVTFKVRVSFRVSVRVSVRVRARVRVRVIRYIQVKSGSHCYGPAAVTTSYIYFGIMIWSKSTVGAIVARYWINCRCNIHGQLLMCQLSLVRQYSAATHEPCQGILVSDRSTFPFEYPFISGLLTLSPGLLP